MAEQNNNDYTNFDVNAVNPANFDPNQNFNSTPNPTTNPIPDFGNLGVDFTNSQTNIPQPNVNTESTFNTANFDQSFPTTPQAPVQDFTNTAPEQPTTNFAGSGFDNQATAPIQDFNSTYSSPEPAATPAVANTFNQTKTGNKTFLIAAIAGGLILLLLAGVLIFTNINSSNNKDKTTEITNSIDQPVTEDTSTKQEEEPAETDNTKTGGDNSLASTSRIYNVNEIPSEWLLQKFRPPAVDQEGNCINISQCGGNADPDQDGAENLEEYNFQLDPLVNDTDKDGIADGDELFIYYSNPSEDDSDNDTYNDGQELVNCFNPSLLTVQFTGEELTTIATNISLQKLHTPTTKSITEAAGTPEDISKNGLVIVKCKAKPAPVSNTSTNKATTTKEQTTSEKEVDSGAVVN